MVLDQPFAALVVGLVLVLDHQLGPLSLNVVSSPPSDAHHHTTGWPFGPVGRSPGISFPKSEKLLQFFGGVWQAAFGRRSAEPREFPRLVTSILRDEGLSTKEIAAWPSPLQKIRVSFTSTDGHASSRFPARRWLACAERKPHMPHVRRPWGTMRRGRRAPWTGLSGEDIITGLAHVGVSGESHE